MDRAFRLFVSSTFSDFAEERRVLDEKVFPALQQYCAARDVRFEPIDLRWGVANEAALKQDTLAICLGEVDRCLRVSPRPSMIALVGQRHGWRPIPQRIDSENVTAMREYLDAALFDRWYRCDENALPPHYLLLPRDQGSRYADPEVWAEEEAQLRDTLVHSARSAGLDGLVEELERSATEHEIRQFIEYDGSRRAFAYLRTIEDLTEADELLRTTFGPDGESGRSLAALTSSIRECDAFAVRSLTTGLGERGLDPDYLREFAGLVLADLQATIDDELEKLAETDEEEAEQGAQRRYGERLIEGMHGRAAEVAAIADYLNGTSTGRPLVVHGPSGVGKSTVMAAAFASLKAASRVLHFVGATPKSANTSHLLAGLCSTFDRTEADHVNSDVAQRFRGLLRERAADDPLFLGIDGIDQLLAGDVRQWFPFVIGEGARVVASVADGPLLDLLKEQLPAECFLPIDALDTATAEVLVADRLDQAGRRLTAGQRNVVSQALLQECSPLYAVLVASLATGWRSFDPVKGLPGSTIELVGAFLEHVVEVDHGREIGGKTLSMLASSKAGLSDSELLAVLSSDAAVEDEFRRRSPNSPATQHLPVIVLIRLLDDLRPLLVEKEGDGALLLDFAHRAIGEAAQAKYAPTIEDKQAVAGQLADYFAALPTWTDAERARRGEPVPTRRKVSEYWHQLELSGNAEDVEFAMADFDQLMASCAANEVPGLAARFYSVADRLNSSRLREWAVFLEREMPRLARGDAQWPAHKVLLQIASEEPFGSTIRNAAWHWLEAGNCGWRWWHSLTAGHFGGTGPVKELAAPAGAANDLAKCGNGNFVAYSGVSGYETGIFVWDSAGQFLHVLRTEFGTPKEVTPLRYGGVAARFDGQRVVIWRADGEIAVTEKFPRMVIALRALDNGNVAVGTREGKIHFYSGEGILLTSINTPSDRRFEMQVEGSTIIVWGKDQGCFLIDEEYRRIDLPIEPIAVFSAPEGGFYLPVSDEKVLHVSQTGECREMPSDAFLDPAKIGGHARGMLLPDGRWITPTEVEGAHILADGARIVKKGDARNKFERIEPDGSRSDWPVDVGITEDGNVSFKLHALQGGLFIANTDSGAAVVGGTGHCLGGLGEDWNAIDKAMSVDAQSCVVVDQHGRLGFVDLSQQLPPLERSADGSPSHLDGTERQRMTALIMQNVALVSNRNCSPVIFVDGDGNLLGEFETDTHAFGWPLIHSMHLLAHHRGDAFYYVNPWGEVVSSYGLVGKCYYPAIELTDGRTAIRVTDENDVDSIAIIPAPDEGPHAEMQWIALNAGEGIFECVCVHDGGLAILHSVPDGSRDLEMRVYDSQLQLISAWNTGPGSKRHNFVIPLGDHRFAIAGERMTARIVTGDGKLLETVELGNAWDMNQPEIAARHPRIIELDRTGKLGMESDEFGLRLISIGKHTPVAKIVDTRSAEETCWISEGTASGDYGSTRILSGNRIISISRGKIHALAMVEGGTVSTMAPVSRPVLQDAGEDREDAEPTQKRGWLARLFGRD